MVATGSKVLNGNFVKEGENFPFCGFPEPWYDKATQSMKPGFEIFHEHQFTEYKDPFLYVLALTVEKDQADLLGDGSLYMLVGDTMKTKEVANCSKMIVPKEGALKNWTVGSSANVPPFSFHYESAKANMSHAFPFESIPAFPNDVNKMNHESTYSFVSDDCDFKISKDLQKIIEHENEPACKVIEDTLTVNLGNENNPQNVSIGTTLSIDEVKN